MHHSFNISWLSFTKLFPKSTTVLTNNIIMNV